MKFHVDQSDGISEYPSDWNCHPDTNLTDIVGEEILHTTGDDGSRSRHLRSTYNVMPIPETYCAMTVANATPRMPHGSTAINKRSNPMFRMAETARNTRGIVEFPSARKRQEK